MPEPKSDLNDFELLCLIVNFGLSSKAIKIAKHHGVLGASIFLGRGTVYNRILKFLDVCESRKEIVIMISEKTIADKVVQTLNRKLQLYKPNHGIIFSTSVLQFWGAKNKEALNINKDRGDNKKMYNAIYTIVDKGKGEDVIDAATKAGSKGGTIINARGSGIHETRKVFSMEIEPEKEIVLIISEDYFTDTIIDKIRTELQIDKPGNGIIFVQDINEIYGIVN